MNPHQWFMAWVRSQQLEPLGHPYKCLKERICKLFSQCYILKHFFLNHSKRYVTATVNCYTSFRNELKWVMGHSFIQDGNTTLIYHFNCISFLIWRTFHPLSASIILTPFGTNTSKQKLGSSSPYRYKCIYTMLMQWSDSIKS